MLGRGPTGTPPSATANPGPREPAAEAVGPGGVSSSRRGRSPRRSSSTTDSHVPYLSPRRHRRAHADGGASSSGSGSGRWRGSRERRAREPGRARGPSEAAACSWERRASWPADQLVGRWVEAARSLRPGRTRSCFEASRIEGAPGVHLVTPLRLAGSDTAVLVLRGFVPAADAVRAETVDLCGAGQVRVVGVAVPIGERRRATDGARRAGPPGRGSISTRSAARSPIRYRRWWCGRRPTPRLPRSPRRLAAPSRARSASRTTPSSGSSSPAMAAAFAVLVVGRTGDSRPPE